VTSAFGTGTYAPEVTSAVYAELSRGRRPPRDRRVGSFDASWIDSARREEARVMHLRARATSSSCVVASIRTRRRIALCDAWRLVRSVGGDTRGAAGNERVMDPWSSSIVIDTTGLQQRNRSGRSSVVAAKSM